MAVVLHVTAEEGSRLWHGFAGQWGSMFSRGERVETRTLLCRGVEGQIFVSERYRDIMPTIDLATVPNRVHGRNSIVVLFPVQRHYGPDGALTSEKRNPLTWLRT